MAGSLLGPGIPDGTGPHKGTPECPFSEEDEEDEQGKLAAKKKKWIPKDLEEGRCTPGSPNYDCPKGSPQYNLAQTFKKHPEWGEKGGKKATGFFHQLDRQYMPLVSQVGRALNWDTDQAAAFAVAILQDVNLHSEAAAVDRLLTRSQEDMMDELRRRVIRLAANRREMAEMLKMYIDDLRKDERVPERHLHQVELALRGLEKALQTTLSKHLVFALDRMDEASRSLR